MHLARTHGLVVCAFALVVALGACGGSSSKSSGSSSTTAASTGGSSGGSSGGSPTTSGSSATGGDAKATCDQITKAMVQPMFTKTLTTVTVKPAGTKNAGQSCQFATADTSNELLITVLSGDDAKNGYIGDTTGISSPVSVPGVGDKATRDGSDSTPIVSSTKGDLYCSVNPQIDDFTGVSALMEAAGDTANIGDKYYADASAAVATLCNRIYGSGNTTPDLSALTSAGAAAASAPTTGATLPNDFTLPTDGSSTP